MPELILKDWYGKEQTFDKETIYIYGKDGELLPFTHGTAETLLVTKNGTYEAHEGLCGYNPVVVDVPAPEIKLQEKTITENGEYTADSGFDGLGKVLVEVAGSGGGSGNVAFGIINNTTVSAAQTITHGLGVVPDIIIVEYIKAYTGGKNAYKGFVGMSTAFANKIGATMVARRTEISDNYGAMKRTNYDYKMDTNASTWFIYNTNTETFSIPAMDATHSYFWVAVAGLT